MPKVIDREVKFMDFLPRLHQSNEQLTEFLSPVQSLYNDFRLKSKKLNELTRYDVCPSKLLPHLAATLGFELLDSPYASVQEQRNLLKWVGWIYRRNGTIPAIDKIIEILGFTATYHETISEPFMVCGTRLFTMDQKKDWIYECAFDNNEAQGWEKQNPGASWQLINNRYIGEGDGTTSALNCSLHENAYDLEGFDWMVSTKFEVLSGSGSWFPYFGIVLYWQSPSNYLRICFATDAGNDYLKMEGNIGGAGDFSFNIANLDGSIDYKTGTHTLRIWPASNGHLAICIDDQTIMAGSASIDHWSIQAKKGLFASESTRVAFDDFKVWRLNIVDKGLLFSTNEVIKILNVKLAGNPDNKVAKTEYLGKILPNYVPFSVTVVVEAI